MPTPAGQDGSLTKFLAAWGALLSTFGLGWNLYRDFHDRGKLKIYAYVGRIAITAEGKHYAVIHTLKVDASEQLVVVMNVTNSGRRPVMWQGWGGKYETREPGGTQFGMLGHGLPKLLHEGESHTEWVELEPDLKPVSDNVHTLFALGCNGQEMAVVQKAAQKSKEGSS